MNSRLYSGNGTVDATRSGTETVSRRVTMSEESAVRRSAVSMTVLVVEDEEVTRKLCSEVAESCGLKAIAVASAADWRSSS